MPFVPKSARQEQRPKTKTRPPPPLRAPKRASERQLHSLFDRLADLQRYLHDTPPPLREDTRSYRPTEPAYYGGSDGYQKAAAPPKDPMAAAIFG